MKKLVFLFVLISGFAFAQKSDEEGVKSTINSFFDAMRNSNSTELQATLSKTAVLQTINKNGEGISEDIQAFAQSLSKAQKGDLDEKIEFKSIQIDQSLASVWTPYQFFYKGKFSHCGVNSFQLVKENGEWKIQYIIDTRRKENCGEVKPVK